jgi:hypothetical protein
MSIAGNLMDKIDRIIDIVRNLKEENGMTSSGITNSANKSGLGFDPKTESPPVFKKYAYLGKDSRSRWMQKRKIPQM